MDSDPETSKMCFQLINVPMKLYYFLSLCRELWPKRFICLTSCLRIMKIMPDFGTGEKLLVNKISEKYQAVA